MSGAEATAAATRLMCALVVRGAFDARILPAFEAAGGRVAIDWAPTAVIMERIAAGETADAVLVLADAMDRLVAQGRVDPGSRVAVARSRYGVAVRARCAPWSSAAPLTRTSCRRSPRPAVG